jgi:predicted oxidoreductase (fatty acid repression mutant protein)
MNATIYFIYELEAARSFSCKNTVEDIEGEIRYWLGKSPGMFKDQLREIVVVPDDQKKDWMYVLQKLEDEQSEAEERHRLKAEKREYDRLKAKYG